MSPSVNTRRDTGPVLSYVAIYGAADGIGHNRIVAVAGHDGTTGAVHGDSVVADDLREVADRAGTGPGWLRTITRGLSYFTVSGPYRFDGDTTDLGYVAAAYGI